MQAQGANWFLLLLSSSSNPLLQHDVKLELFCVRVGTATLEGTCSVFVLYCINPGCSWRLASFIFAVRSLHVLAR